MLVFLCGNRGAGAWLDRTAGRPLVENFLAKDLGTTGESWITVHDRLGRLFVGGDQLRVFDGQAWRSFPVPNSYSLKALAFGDDDRLWAGAANEVGYFAEESLGVFKYYSLLKYLPEKERALGVVWSCVPVGRNIYFFCHEKILRWDGTTFHSWAYPGGNRIFPVKLNNEPWFHHLETGLYRMTEAGPQLEVPAVNLPARGIIGLARDTQGLLVMCGLGIFRPGAPPVRISDDKLSEFIAAARLASFAVLPNGDLAIGTLEGGLALVARSGGLQRILDPSDGLPSRAIFSIEPDGNGNIWCTTPDGIFQMEAEGHATLFGPANGLKGQGVVDVKSDHDRLYALTREGVFELATAPALAAHFQTFPDVSALYADLRPFRGGLLLSRFEGMDFAGPSGTRPVFSIGTKNVFFAQPSPSNPDSFYLSEQGGLGRLVAQPDGSFIHSRFLEFADNCNSLHEEAGSRLWFGTEGTGAYVYDLGTSLLTPVNDPATGGPFTGRVFIAPAGQKLLFFHRGRVLLGATDGSPPQVLENVPPVDLVATQLIPGNTGRLIAFKRTGPAGTIVQGLGLLTLDQNGHGEWREFDVPALHVTGFLRTLAVTLERQQPVVWLAGTDGLVRLDLATLPALKNPETPLVRLDASRSSQPRAPGDLSFPFRDHRIGFRVFVSNPARSKDWLFQSRLGTGKDEWSAASPRRSYEYTSLSEGDYRFEVRTINPAGQASEPAVFAFRILPPWYRAPGAFAGYLAALGLGVFAFIRVRERRIRARNQELEAIVEVRTAELVKASAAKDEFLAGISHEIRNPMNGVIGIADNFKTEGLDPESRRKFGLLRQCATHLSSLLEDILDFSRVQAGAVDIEAKPFDLTALMESIVGMTAADSEKRGIPVEVAVSPAVPRHLVGDAKRLRQILLNFTSNALKFSGGGKVSVTVWCKTPGPERTEVIFAVSDEGPGISLEEQKRLFTRFERGAAAQQGRVPGTGLGLALCKGLAEKMGGRIWLESEPGHGSCFSFSAPFPIAAAPAESVPIAAAPAPAHARTALVVDDQEYNRVVLVDLLEALGFEVQDAAEGTTALALAAKNPFDVVLLDFNLPGLSGLDVTHGIRALPNASATAYILATTAFSTPEKRAQCLAAGMNAFLGKPVTMERLRKALADAPPAKPEPAAAPDGLANLRLLARKKKTPFADELALYLSEFDLELEHLSTALRAENAADAGHYAHLLYGRCGFIAERDLEQTLRKIEAVSATAQWDEAHALGRDVQAQRAALRVRLSAAAGPVAPPASGR